MSFIAKQLQKTEWIVTDGTSKVGSISVNSHGHCRVTINGVQQIFGDISNVSQNFDISFTNLASESKTTSVSDYTEVLDQWPELAKEEVYNVSFDLVNKVHIFTKTPESKRFYAMGWFSIYDETTKKTKVIFCPKHMLVQRHTCRGPFKTKEV